MRGIIIPGTDSSGRVFQTGDVVLAEDLTAAFNLALRIANEGIDDSNIRPRELSLGYKGISEAAFAFADSDGVGHNHDGLNSAPLGPKTVDAGVLWEDSDFLRHADSTPSTSEYLFMASGKVSTKWDFEFHPGHATDEEFLFTIAFPYDLGLVTNFSNVRVTCTLMLQHLVVGDNARQWLAQPSMQFSGVSTGQGGVFMKAKICRETNTATVGYTVRPKWGPADGTVGLSWVATGLVTLQDPTA